MDGKSNRFPTPSLNEWKKRSKKSLKGRSFDELYTDTYEGITLKPLYTKEDRKSFPQYPGQRDFRRGSFSGGYLSHAWEIAQIVSIKKGISIYKQFQSVFEKGQTAISFSSQDLSPTELKQLEPFHQHHPYCVNGKKQQLAFINELETLPSANFIYGYIGQDPVALYVENGAEKDTVASDYDQFALAVKKGIEKIPNLKTILVDTTPYHNGGANAVQELAIAISTAVFHIEELRKRKMTVDDLLDKFVFQFSIGNHFFMELAKLRAARMIWSKICESYGAAGINGMVISANTSYFTKTIYDPYVNLLRSASEAFTAILGNIQYLHVSPFNELEGKTTEFSERIARNIQLLMKEESYVAKTIDPAGGSYFIECLTEQLTEKSWALFLKIEEEGGIIEALKRGMIQIEIGNVKKKRDEDVFTRKQIIVGTNKYANLNDEPLNEKRTEERKCDNLFIAPIRQLRLAEPFERLRKLGETLAGRRKQPKIGLLTLGKLKEHKARADFIESFLTPGGIELERSGEIFTEQQLITFIDKSNLHIFTICGPTDRYKEMIPILNKVTKRYPDHAIFFVCHPKEISKEIVNLREEFFIHENSNCYETISKILQIMEGKTNG